MSSKQEIRMLQGTVLDIEKTGEKKEDEEGNLWEKCIFSLELTGFSKRTPKEVVPSGLESKKVKLVRWCTFDWHYKTGVRKTLEPDETEAVIQGEPTDSIYW
ncbi:MAG: hypothetical protein ACETWM_01805 [Candidatus Lokiarchaeia archaeon]